MNEEREFEHEGEPDFDDVEELDSGLWLERIIRMKCLQLAISTYVKDVLVEAEQIQSIASHWSKFVLEGDN